MSVAELGLVLKAQDEASKVIHGLEGNIKGLATGSTAAGKHIGELGNHLDSARSSAERARGGFGGLVDTLGKLGLAGMGISALTGAIAGLATGMTAGNAEFERYEVQFGVLLGSSKAAKDRLSELAEFGATTPFELPGVVVADKILQGFGLHSEEAAKKFGFSGKEIRTIAGDVAAGSGAAFDQMAGYIGKFASGATGEAIARFQELGILTREQLSKMGVAFSKSGELMSPLPQAMTAILTLMKQKYGGMMDAQSKTFEGMMSNLTDWIGNTKRKLMAPLFDVLKDKLQGVLEFLGSPAVTGALDSFAQMLASGMSTAITTLSTLGDIMGNLLGVFGGAEGAGLHLHNALEKIVGLDIANILILAVQGFQGLGTAIKSVTDVIGNAWSAFQAGGDVFGQLQDDLPWLASLMKDLAPTGERLGRMFAAIKDAIGAFVPRPLMDLVSGLAGTATNSDNLKSALKLLTDAINAISGAVESATKFVADHKEVQAALVGIIAPIAAIFVAIKIAMLAQAVATGVLTTATGLLTAAQTALNVVMAMNPIAIVVLALVGLVAGLIYAYQTSEDFRRIVDNVWKTIKDTVGSVWKYISGIFDAWVTYFTQTLPKAVNDLSGAIGGAWDTIKNAVGGAWSGIQSLVQGAQDIIRNTIQSAWSGIQSLVQGAQDIIRNTIQSAWSGIPEDIRADLVLIANHLATKFQEFIANITGWLDSIKTSISNAWESIRDAISTTLTGIRDNVIAPILDAIKGVLVAAWTAISGAISAAWEGFKNIINTKLTETRDDVVAPVSDGIKGVLDAAWLAVQNAVGLAWEAVKTTIASKLDAVTGALSVVGNFAGDVLAKLGGLAIRALDLAEHIGQAIIDGIKAGINAGWKALTDLVGDLARGLLGAAKRALGIGSPSKEFFKIGQQIIDGLVAGIESRNTSFIDAVRATLKDSISMMESLIGRMVGGPSASILGRGASAIEALRKVVPAAFGATGVPSMIGPIGERIAKAAGEADILRQVQDVVAAMQEMGMTIDQVAIDALRDLGANLSGPFKERLEKFLDSLPAQEAMRGLRAILEEADLARQLASTASMLQSLGQTMPATMRAILEALPREAGGILDTIIKQLLAGAIPGFQSGGVVPGPRGAPMLIKAHGGEVVSPAGQAVTNYYTQNIYSNAPTDQTIANFRLLQALS